MSIIAKWTTTCTGCGKVVEKELQLTEESCYGFGWTDIWGPGWPKGWMQIPYDEVTDTHYLFFHNHNCYKNWLRKQDRLEEIREFDEGIWVA